MPLQLYKDIPMRPTVPLGCSAALSRNYSANYSLHCLSDDFGFKVVTDKGVEFVGEDEL